MALYCIVNAKNNSQYFFCVEGYRMSCKMCEKQKNIKDDPYFIMELETGVCLYGEVR